MAEIIADKNAPYLFSAYAIFLGIFALYFVSLRLRRRGIERQQRALDALEREEREEREV